MGEALPRSPSGSQKMPSSAVVISNVNFGQCKLSGFCPCGLPACSSSFPQPSLPTPLTLNSIYVEPFFFIHHRLSLPQLYLGVGQSEAKFMHRLAGEMRAKQQPSLLPSLAECPEVNISLSALSYNPIPFEIDFGEDLSLRLPFRFLFPCGQMSPSIHYQLRYCTRKCVLSHKAVPRSKMFYPFTLNCERTSMTVNVFKTTTISSLERKAFHLEASICNVRA